MHIRDEKVVSPVASFASEVAPVSVQPCESSSSLELNIPNVKQGRSDRIGMPL